MTAAQALVDRLLEAFNTGDESFVGMFDDEVELRPAGAAAATVYKGQVGVKAWRADLDDAWEEFVGERNEVTPVGDRFLVEFQMHGRGRSSGLEIEQDFFLLLKFRDDKVVDWRNFESRDEALEAARALPASG